MGTPKHQGLTPRQAEVLNLLRQGMTITEIAAALGCKRGTVSTHLKMVRAKAKVTTNAALMRQPTSAAPRE